MEFIESSYINLRKSPIITILRLDYGESGFECIRVLSMLNEVSIKMDFSKILYSNHRQPLILQSLNQLLTNYSQSINYLPTVDLTKTSFIRYYCYSQICSPFVLDIVTKQRQGGLRGLCISIVIFKTEYFILVRVGGKKIVDRTATSYLIPQRTIPQILLHYHLFLNNHNSRICRLYHLYSNDHKFHIATLFHFLLNFNGFQIKRVVREVPCRFTPH